jgi:hypothetical protein
LCLKCWLGSQSVKATELRSCGKATTCEPGRQFYIANGTAIYHVSVRAFTPNPALCFGCLAAQRI